MSGVTSTGLPELDRVTGGLAGGSLTVIASRPSLGKSLLALQIADHIARSEKLAVAIVCASGGAPTVARRIVAIHAGESPLAFASQPARRTAAAADAYE